MLSFRDIHKQSLNIGRELSGEVVDEAKKLGVITNEGNENNVIIDQKCQNTFHTHIISDNSIRDNVLKFGCDVPSCKDYASFISKGYMSLDKYATISDTVISEHGEAKFTVASSFFTKWSRDNFILNMLIVQAYFFWLSGLSNVAFLNREQYLKMIHNFNPSFLSKIVENFIQVEGEKACDEIIKGFSINHKDFIPVFPLRETDILLIEACDTLDVSNGLTLKTTIIT